MLAQNKHPSTILESVLCCCWGFGFDLVWFGLDVFETGSLYIVWAGLELAMVLLSTKCEDYMCALPCPNSQF